MTAIVLSFLLIFNGYLSNSLSVLAAEGDSGTQAPYLLITEMLVHDGQDGKYVELYNNSNADINLSSYEIRYLWSHDAAGNHAAMEFPEGAVLKAGDTMLIINPTASAESINELYGSSLTDEDVYPVLSVGMAYNTRGIAIYEKNTEEVVVAALYSTAQAGKSQEYFYEGEVDGNGIPIMTSDGTFQDPTPGTLMENQAPQTPASLPEELYAPVLTHKERGMISALDAKLSVEMSFVAGNVQDGAGVNLYYKLDGQEEYQMIEMEQTGEQEAGEPLSFETTISPKLLQNTTSISYYFEGTNGQMSSRLPAGEEVFQSGVTQEELTAPYLMITEMLVHDGQDGKYVELYNNSNADINLSSYEIRYLWSHDVTGDYAAMEFPEGAVLKAGDTVVLINPTASAESINKLYGSALTEEDVYPVLSLGMAYNTRGIAIYEKNTEEMVVAALYSTAQAGKSQEYFYEGEADGNGIPIMTSDGTFQNPTPGALVENQAPQTPASLPEELYAPVLTHQKNSELPSWDARFSVELHYIAASEEISEAQVSMVYQFGNEAETYEIPMERLGDGQSSPLESVTYEAVIPEELLQDVDRVFYYFQAEDGVSSSRLPVNSGKYNTAIYQEEKEVTAEILITELLPKSKDNQYSYIEIYNNTNREINLKDYRLVDQASNGANTFYDFTQDRIVKPGEVVVIWAKNEDALDKTVDDFNQCYQTSLTEEQIVTLDKAFSMYVSDAEERRIVIATDSGDMDTRREGLVSGVKAKAVYSRYTQEAIEGRSIQYQAPIDGSVIMKEISANQTPTPGIIELGQVPEERLTFHEDTQAPTIQYEAPETVNYGDLNLTVQAFDDQEVKRVTLFYKTEDQSSYRERNMILASDMDESLPEQTFKLLSAISKETLASAEELEYYFEVSDGFHTTTSEQYQLTILHPEKEPLGFNLEEGENVSRIQTVPDMVITEIEIYGGNGQKFLEIYNSSGRDLNLADYEYRYWWTSATSGYNTYTFPAEIDQTLKAGEILVLCDPETSVEEFNAIYGTDLSDEQVIPCLFTGIAYADRGFAIVKADTGEVVVSASFTGSDAVSKKTVVYTYDYDSYGKDVPEMVHWKTGQEPTPGTLVEGQEVKALLPITVNKPENGEEVQGMLDQTPVALTEKEDQYVYYADLDEISEGSHTFTVATSSGANSTLHFTVDNSSPAIENVWLEEGRTYTSQVCLDGEISDGVSGIAEQMVLLDGQEYALGTVLMAGQMEEGSHRLELYAQDQAGNESSYQVNFRTEKNDLTVSGGENQTDTSVSPTLNVKINAEKDTVGDITFYEAYQYNFNTGGVSGWENNTSMEEPPAMLNPEGEKAISSEGEESLKKVDGNYLTTGSETAFPYQRFDFTVSQNIDPEEEVEFVWTGNTLEGRTVIIYFWNFEKEAWVEGARGTGTEDFVLTACAKAGDVVKENTVHVLVQDPIENEEESSTFTFAWFSDPQYYSESFPYIWESMANYLVGPAREEKNIQYVINTGDIVDEYNLDYQWERADEAFRILEENNLPYGVVAGNHDVDHENVNYSKYYEYFGRDRVENQSVFGGDRENNRDHYDLVSVGGYDFVIVYLGWGLTEESIDWANEVFASYPDRYGILATHEYLSTDGQSYSGNGQKLWDEVVNPNSNVFLVLSGHLHGVAYNEITADDGRKVTQVLADYQGGKEGGQGFMRFLEFDMENKVLNMTTYSPYTGTDHYFSQEEENFVIDLSGIVKSPEKTVNTDYISLNVYSNKEIGTLENVQFSSETEGTEASLLWNNLQEGETYSWFAVATEENGSSARSAIWNLTTKETSQGGGTEDPGDNGNNGDQQKPGGQNPEDPENTQNPDGTGQGSENQNGNTESPVTGDSLFGPGWICLFLLVIGAGAAAFVRLRKLDKGKQV